MDPVVELNEADKIARRILTKQSVSDDDFRYAVMFNLTAMTQLLWELSNTQLDTSKNKLRTARTGSDSRIGRGSLKNKVLRLAPLAAIAAFLAGVGLGYVLP